MVAVGPERVESHRGEGTRACTFVYVMRQYCDVRSLSARALRARCRERAPRPPRTTSPPTGRPAPRVAHRARGARRRPTCQRPGPAAPAPQERRPRAALAHMMSRRFRWRVRPPRGEEAGSRGLARLGHRSLSLWRALSEALRARFPSARRRRRSSGGERGRRPLRCRWRALGTARA